MTYLHESNLTVNLTSVNGGAAGGASSAGYGYGQASTHMTGYLESIYFSIPAACGTTSFIRITTSTTSKVLLRVLDPTSNAVTYYPRQVSHNSTDGVAVGSSVGNGVPIALKNERITAVVQTSSAVKYLGTDVTIKAIWS